MKIITNRNLSLKGKVTPAGKPMDLPKVDAERMIKKGFARLPDDPPPVVDFSEPGLLKLSPDRIEELAVEMGLEGKPNLSKEERIKWILERKAMETMNFDYLSGLAPESIRAIADDMGIDHSSIKQTRDLVDEILKISKEQREAEEEAARKSAEKEDNLFDPEQFSDFNGEALEALNKDEQIELLKHLGVSGYSRWNEGERILAIMENRPPEDGA